MNINKQSLKYIYQYVFLLFCISIIVFMAYKEDKSVLAMETSKEIFFENDTMEYTYGDAVKKNVLHISETVENAIIYKSSNPEVVSVDEKTGEIPS